MPIYDYHCPKCGEDFELLVRASTTPACPHCAATELERRLSLTAPQGKIKAIIASNRRAAAREGHFSNYSPAERARLLKS
ncbi:FmdB family zinc ribbon protein [Azohydromonas aeria]|uniref:FmdB family zinc ribbon protein n=1 Tax=Azohydromonas aeria TaxID=2590212 RepID=UPI0012FBBCC9|nr:zinc ribbon domain-containing protein [Azohydromonas aeria]